MYSVLIPLIYEQNAEPATSLGISCNNEIAFDGEFNLNHFTYHL